MKNSAVYSLSQLIYRYRLMYTKCIIKIVRPAPYERDVWDYKQMGTNLMQPSLNIFNW